VIAPAGEPAKQQQKDENHQHQTHKTSSYEQKDVSCRQGRSRGGRAAIADCAPVLAPPAQT
jgi:hypothetical protein